MPKVPKICEMKKTRFEQERREQEKFYHPTKKEKQKSQKKSKKEKDKLNFYCEKCLSI